MKLKSMLFTAMLMMCSIASAQGFHPCDTNHDGVVDVSDITTAAKYILTGEYEPGNKLPDDEVAITGDATDIAYTKATLNVSIQIPKGVTACAVSVIYSKNPNPNEDNGTVLNRT